MPSRRQFTIALLGTILSAGMVALPLQVTLKEWRLRLSAQSAVAKDGKGGGSRGGGNGGGKANGGGRGNGNTGGKSNGQGGGSGNRSGGKSKSGAQASAGAAASGQRYNPKTGDTIQINGSTIEVLHRNGMREKVSGGSYEMKDSKSRTIIERLATGADLARLRYMLN